VSFVRAIPESELREKGRALFRQGTRQIALFSVGDAVHAVDNRCPHEGYPLLQGSVAPEKGLLTCRWHNWKFDLGTGDCVLGEDHVRRYPTRIDGGYVEIDLTDPPLETIESEILRGLEGAVQERQYGRIAREISRLMVHGLDPVVAVRKAIELSYDRFEFGTTHAYAALADWLALYDHETDIERKVVCLTEALDHVADRFAAIVAAHGPDAIAFYVSGQLLTEDYHVFNKLTRGAPRERRSSGCSARTSRSAGRAVRCRVAPLEQSLPKFAGWSGSPRTPRIAAPSVSIRTPHPTPQ